MANFASNFHFGVGDLIWESVLGIWLENIVIFNQTSHFLVAVDFFRGLIQTGMKLQKFGMQLEMGKVIVAGF